MFTWIDKRLALAIHDRQLAEHGGIPGVRYGSFPTHLRPTLGTRQHIIRGDGCRAARERSGVHFWSPLTLCQDGMSAVYRLHKES
jgi:hypothetical protein